MVLAPGAGFGVGRPVAPEKEKPEGYEGRDPDDGDRERSAVPQPGEPAIEIIEKQRGFSAEALQFAPVHPSVGERYRIGLAVHHDDFGAFQIRGFAGRHVDQESAAQADYRNRDGPKGEAFLHRAF